MIHKPGLDGYSFALEVFNVFDAIDRDNAISASRLVDTQNHPRGNALRCTDHEVVYCRAQCFNSTGNQSCSAITRPFNALKLNLQSFFFEESLFLGDVQRSISYPCVKGHPKRTGLRTSSLTKDK